MMTASLANILDNVGVNIKYPHDVQTPDRLQSTRERAKQLSTVIVQPVEDYKRQKRSEIFALLED